MLSRCTAPGGVKVALIAIMVVTSSVSASTRLYRRDFDLLIPSPDDPHSEEKYGWMEDAIIDVPDSFVIKDVDINIDFTHGAFVDLQIILQSPAGTNVVLNPPGNSKFFIRGEDGRLKSAGGYREWLFDDDADMAITAIEEATETVPFLGPYRPFLPYQLSDFFGEDAFGQWKLMINDGARAHSGTLHSVELIFTTVPEPGTVFLIGAGAILLRLKRRDR